MTQPVTHRAGMADPRPPAPATVEPFRLPLPSGARLIGELTWPDSPVGLVVLAQGDSNSRHDPRNRQLAGVLCRRGLGSLLLDLLTPAEDRDRSARFDVDRLASRLDATVNGLRASPSVEVPIGLLGTGTGTAAALAAAAVRRDEVVAVVSLGGRPDLAADRLERVRTPTLLIVGQADHEGLEHNRSAVLRLSADAVLEVVPGATRHFDEPEKLDCAAELAAAWFLAHMRSPRGESNP